MPPFPAFQLNPLQRQLLRQTRAWAWRQGFDPVQMQELRQAALLANHAHYLAHIPAYQRLAQEAGIGALTTLDPIKQQLMFPDDLFKSYNQQWLDDQDFTSLNHWLAQIFHGPTDVDVREVTTIDDWLARLNTAGTRVVYSSGTSGTFSFIPRDHANWALFQTFSSAYLAPLLVHHHLGTPLQQLLLRVGSQLLPPEVFARLSRRGGLRDYDAFFLDFSQGRTGNQTLSQELAPLFRRHYFLYETTLSPTVLRLATRGPKTAADHAQLQALQTLVGERKMQSYDTLITRLQATIAAGQKYFIFGTTQQYKELAERLLAQGTPLRPRAGSLALFGGGWKSFTGERLAREPLLVLLAQALGLPATHIVEGYSMTELNAFTLRCELGRFHLPPFIEPVIFDEQLEVITGDDVRGTFGFLDPLATTYPGFIISGDAVHFVQGPCACGLSGPAVTEIGRARYREVKGCGGIIASLAA